MKTPIEIEVCCPHCLSPLREEYSCGRCGWKSPGGLHSFPFRVAGCLAYGESGLEHTVEVQVPESLAQDSPESKLIADIARLRALLKRCEGYVSDFGVGSEREQLLLDIMDELAKE